MVFGIRVKETPDHPLILGVVLARLSLEEVDTPFAQGDSDLDSFVPEDEIFRERQKVTDDSQSSKGLIRVFHSHAHTFVYLFANTRHRRFGRRSRGT
jgi:hypothetical protein